MLTLDSVSSSWSAAGGVSTVGRGDEVPASAIAPWEIAPWEIGAWGEVVPDGVGESTSMMATSVPIGNTVPGLTFHSTNRPVYGDSTSVVALSVSIT